MKIMREEIFGPVVAIARFKTEEEVIEMANDTTYGLAAGIHTKDYERAIRVTSALEAGTVWVNMFNFVHWRYVHHYAYNETPANKISTVCLSGKLTILHTLPLSLSILNVTNIFSVAIRKAVSDENAVTMPWRTIPKSKLSTLTWVFEHQTQWISKLLSWTRNNIIPAKRTIRCFGMYNNVACVQISMKIHALQCLCHCFKIPSICFCCVQATLRIMIRKRYGTCCSNIIR